MEQVKNKTLRREYHKPCVEHVRLIAEEVVLAECKNESQTGPAQGDCGVYGPSACPNIS